MRNWRSVWGIFLALGLTFVVINLRPAGAQPSLVGSYRLVGQNPNGTAYKGTAKITQNGANYLLEWNIAGSRLRGIGIVEGNLLATSWQVTEAGRLKHGVSVYRIETGRLVGRWAEYPGNGLGSEILTLAK